MQIHNSEIADTFNKLADLLEIKGENPFRIKAYRNAARIISSLSKDLAMMLEEGIDITEIPGIGESIASKIKTIIATHKLPLLQKTESHTPAILSELMRIEGLGPKRVLKIYKKLHVRNLNDLKKAITQGKIQEIPGFGEKTAQKILSGIKHLKVYQPRFKLTDVFPLVENILKYLIKSKAIKLAECAGSFRRHKETVGDLDFIAISNDNNKAIEHFIKFDEVIEVLSKGATRSTVRLRSGIQVDLRVVPPISYGAALLYFTGSKAHNIHIRKIALQKKMKINEYGVYKSEKYIAGKSEKEIYQKIGLPFIEPELREDRGEIEIAKSNKLPKLIQLNDIRGDLHCHTNEINKTVNLERIAHAAAELGYEYIAITDHTKHLHVPYSLDKKKLLQQIKLIDRLNQKLKKIVILKGSEVEILEDGSLDLPNEILKELDITVCSVHSKFNLSAKKQTDRIIRAMDNPFFNILGHPTGRLINQREAYQLNIETIMRAAKERGCILELNAQPERLDIDDINCKMAKEMKVKIAISTGANSASQLNFMQYGIFQARRGWLEKSDVINTRPLSELMKLLERK